MSWNNQRVACFSDMRECNGYARSSRLAGPNLVWVFANKALMQVYRVSIWMGKFLSATPKPTLLWSSTSAISGFWSCRKFSLKKFKAKAEHRPSLKPTIQYRDKAGRKRWQGTSDLTKTQILGITMCDCCSNPSVS